MNKYHDLANNFRKEIVKDWGKTCKEFSLGCIVCQAHRILYDLEELGIFLADANNFDRKHNHKK